MAVQFAVDILFKALGTDKLRQATAETSKVEKAAEKLNGRLLDTKGRFISAGQGAEQAANGIKKFGLASAAAKAANDKLNDALSLTALKLAVVGTAVKYFQGFKEADRAAAAVRTLGVDAKVLEQQLLNVSNRMGGLYSQTQLMTSAYDVASAGFMNAADNAKVLEAAAKGAVGGMADINEVANATTSVLNAYGKSAGEAGKLVDGFIQTQNDGKIVVAEYSQYIGKLAPVGRAAGISIEELNAAISTATAQGLPVEATFTGLAQAITSILKPSKEASDLAEALGIGFNEAALKSKGLGGVLADVKAKTGNSATAMTQLFGSVEAVKAILPLTNDDLVKFNKNLANQANAAGVADKAVAEMGGTVSSEITKMINQIGNFARTLDTVLAPVFGTLIKLINMVIAEATKGINVLGQLFSMSKDTAILKQALESGDLRRNNVARVLGGVDQLIGDKRRQELQRQAGAGTGFLGLGFNAKKFAELLKKEPAIQKLLGTGKTPAAAPPLALPIDPKVQATLDALNNDGEKKKRASQKKLQDEQEKIDKELAQNRVDLDNQVFKNQQDLIKQRYDLESELAEKMAGIWANGFQGAARDQANAINQLIKSGEDFGKRVSDLKTQIAAQQQAIKSAEAGIGVAALGGTGGGGGRVGQPIEYLTGDRRHAGYRADHGGGNYHEHIAYQTAKEARAAAELLNRNGIKTTELLGVNPVGRHSPNSPHYSGRAFDVPAAQVPVGQEQALSARVRQILGIGGAGTTGASGAVVSAQGNAATAKEELAGLQQQLQQLMATEQQFKALDMAAFIQQSTDAFKGQTDSLVKQTEALQLKNRLEMEGVNPALIEGELQKLQVSQQLTERQDALKQALDAGIITNDQYAAALEAVKTAAQGTVAAIDAYAQAVLANQNKIAQYINKLKTELSDTQGMIVSLASTIESEIGSAMSNAIIGLIDGTQTAEEAFSQMFKNIGKAFIDMATQMIAKWLVMQVLGIFGGGGGGFFNPIAFTPGLKLFAEGGFVTGPTNALIGEAGESEYVIPASKMSSAMANYSAGKRGSSVITDSGTAASGEGAGGAINVTYTVERINERNYVSEEAFQRGLRQAAKQGAEGGYNKTMGAMRNSRSQRSRIGLR